MPTYFLQPIEEQEGGGFQPSPVDLGNRIRYVGQDAPNTTGWSANSFWYDTTDEGTTGAVMRRWTGTAFVPAPTAPLLDEDFAGANGNPWGANWTTGRNPTAGTGGGATLQDGYGKLTTSNAGSYNGGARVSRRADITAPTDVNVVFSFKFDSTECYPRVYARADNAIDTDDGYFMDIQKGEYYIGYSNGYATTDLSDPIPFSHTVGATYAARFYVVGTAVRAKVWLLSDTEPAAWGAQATDSTFSSAGAVGFTLGTGAAATSSNFWIDDVVIRDS